MIYTPRLLDSHPFRPALRWVAVLALLCAWLPTVFASDITVPDLMAIELPNPADTTIADSAAPMSPLLASVTSINGPVSHDRVGYSFPIGPTLVTFDDGVAPLAAYVYVYPYGQTPIGVTGTDHGTAANKSANAVRDVNGILHVAWYDQRPSEGISQVMYRRGTQDPNTGEITWAIPPTRISDAANESPDRNFVAVAASDTAVYFAWYRGSSPTSNNAVLRLDTSTMIFGPIVNTGCPGRFSSTGCDLAVRSHGGVSGQDQVCILTPGLAKFAMSKQNGAAGSWTVEDVAAVPAGRTWKMGAMDLDQWGNVHIAYSCNVRGAAGGTYSETSGNSAYWELRYARRNATTGSWEDDHYLLQQFAPEWQDPQAPANPRADTDDLLTDWPDILVDDRNDIHVCWHGSQNTGIYGNDEAFYIRRPSTGVNSWAAQWDPYHSLKPIIPPKGFSWAPSLCGEGNSHLALPVVFYNWDPDTSEIGADNMIMDSRYQAFRDGAPEGSPVQLSTYAQFGVAGWFPSVNPHIYRHANGRAWMDVMRCDKMPAANNSNNVILFQRAEVTDRLYPLVITPPADQVVLAGNTAGFSVTANGVNLNYQWQKNGVDISGATSSSYTTPATVPADNGALFSVKISNPAGAVVSLPANLWVLTGANAAPTLDSGTTATPNPVINGSLSVLTVVAHDNDSGPAPLTFTWLQTAGPTNGVSFSPNGTTNADTTTATFLVDGTYTLQVSISDGAATVTDSISLDVTLAVSGSTTVYLQDGLNGYAGTQDTYLNAFSPDTNYGNSAALEVRWFTGGTVENDIGLLKFNTTSIPSTATVTSAQLDLWVTRTNSVSGSDVLVMQKNTGPWSESSTYNTGVPAAVASGVATPTLSGLPGSASPVDPPVQYTITGLSSLVQGWVGTPASNQGVQFSCASDINLRFASRDYGTPAVRPMLTVTYAGGSLTGPSIIGQPQDVTVTVGQTAVFGVVVTGSAPITCQWFKNSTPIGGATAATYTTPATLLGDDTATFHVVVTNSQGSVTSNPVTLTVNPVPNAEPVITTPASATPNPVTTGFTTTVSVFASDADSYPSALTYTWSKVSGPGTVNFSPNGTTGASSATASFSFPGVYTLKVDVSDGAATVSSTVDVTVTTQILIFVDSVNLTLVGPKKDLQGVATIHNGAGNPVAGLSITCNLFKDGVYWASRSGTTAGDGTFTFVQTNAAAGTLTARVSALSGTGYSWNGVSPVGSVVKTAVPAIAQSVALQLVGSNQDLKGTATIQDGSGNPLSGLAITCNVFQNGAYWVSRSGVTAADGTFTFTQLGAPSATLTARVSALSGVGFSWNGISPWGTVEKTAVAATVQSIGMQLVGVNEDLQVTPTIWDPSNNPMAGLTVTCNIFNNGVYLSSRSGVTNASGQVTLTHPAPAPGTLTARVTAITGTNITWNRSTPIGSIVKTGNIAVVQSIGMALVGGNQDLQVTPTIWDGSNNPVAGLTVTCNLFHNGVYISSRTGVTNASGQVALIHPNPAAGTLTARVIAITGAGYTWNGVTPVGSIVK